MASFTRVSADYGPALVKTWSLWAGGAQAGFEKDEKDTLALLLFDYAMVYSMKRDIPYVMKFMSSNKAL